MKVILIVEDEFFQREYLHGVLVDAGYDVIEAENAREAIGVLESREDINLIITDVNMPGSIDGMQLAATVRKRWPPIPIIITTGRARPQADEMPSCSRFISKPYAPTQVLSVIEQLGV